MNSSASSRAGWFRASLETLLVLMLVGAAFLAGRGLAQRRVEKAVREAQATADVARRQAELARLELLYDGAGQYGLPPPPLPGGNSPQGQVKDQRDLPVP